MASIRLSALALTLSLMTAAPQAAEPDDRPNADDERPDPEAQVCRRVKVTGTHMRQRVCYKQKEWDRLREESQREMRERRPDFTGGSGQNPR